MNDARFEERKDTIYVPQRVEKIWGYELVLWNTPEYCGKVLVFNRNAHFSMHFHINKTETWYISSGSFYLDLIKDGKFTRSILKTGDCITIQPGTVHQLHALEEYSILFEVSTEHWDHDSYRIYRNTPSEITP